MDNLFQISDEKNRKELKSKKIGITGGTGSFGNTVLNELIKCDVCEVRILSRDEKKQDDLRKKLNDSRVKFIIGDVRSRNSVNNLHKIWTIFFMQQH